MLGLWDIPWSLPVNGGKEQCAKREALIHTGLQSLKVYTTRASGMAIK